MKKQSDELRKKLIGLGEDSTRKSYYPELQAKIRLLEESKQQLLDSYNQRRDFMRNILHELRTPLHGIGGLLRILRGELLQGHQQKVIEDMLTSLSRLENLVGEIQNIADEGLTDLDRYGSLCINDIVENTVSPIVSKAALDGVFDIVIPEGFPTNLQGKIALFQVGLSLFLKTALYFDHLKRPYVAFSLEHEKMESADLMVKLTFAEGKLTEEQVKRFFSLIQEGSRSLEGDKVEFVEAAKLCCCGGVISLSQGDTTSFFWNFRFDLIAEELMQSLSIEPTSPAIVTDSSQPNVLLVEDNEINLSAMELILEDKKCNIFSARNGREAFELFQQRNYALIFMDMKMPIMGGEESILLIREYEAKASIPHTPIIAITAFAMTGDRERILELGADDYLAKPFDFSLFESITEKYIKL